MSTLPEERFSEIRNLAKDIARDIQSAAYNNPTEDIFREKLESIIEKFANEFNIPLRVKDEYILANGRADTVYNRLVIEWERPGVLKHDNSYSGNQHAIGQLKQYIVDIDKEARFGKERMLGIATDGIWIIYAKYREKEFKAEKPVRVDYISIERFLLALESLVGGAAFIPDNLSEDFGNRSPVSKKCVSVFYDKLKVNKSPKVEVLFNQWKIFFSEVCSYQEATTKINLKELAEDYGISDDKINPFFFFFSIHTYYAVLMKFLALMIVSYYVMPKMGHQLEKIILSKELEEDLREIEEGSIFRNLGIKNFLEGDFFGWYLENWDKDKDEAVRAIMNTLNEYDPFSIKINPEETRDLLKKMYQRLVPKELRHALGEYYTPDWLAERLLNQVGYDGDPDKRLLDPACGSGTFIMLALKRIKAYAQNHKQDNRELLGKVLKNIVGIDLNPLAVIASRTNFIMALGEFLTYMPKEGINIPIYLADSILTPVQESSLLWDAYFIKTSVTKFEIPALIVKTGNLNNLTELLDSSIKNKYPVDEFLNKATTVLKISSEEFNNVKKSIEDTYRKLKELDDKGINHIWARIIQNAFAPLFIGRFDYVVGNPPWVNWESLPEEYREDTKPLWNKYGLFTLKGHAARLGGGKKDISMLFVYVGVDKYLKQNCKLGFVITQSLFQTKGAGEGFRKFKLNEKTSIKIIAVDDMTELQPFEAATNRTSVLICQRDHITNYPVSYTVWKKEGERVSISLDYSLEEVLQKTKRLNLYAAPIDASNSYSPWSINRIKNAELLKNVTGKSHYKAWEGSNTGGANGVYWIEIKENKGKSICISNLNDIGKKKVKKVEGDIESRFAYPLLRGRDVHKWQAQASAYIIAVQDPTTRIGYKEEFLKKEAPKTYNFLYEFKDFLQKRPLYKKFFNPKQDAFYSMYNIGEYTFKQNKVVWKYIATELTAAVVTPAKDKFLGQKIIIPDCKLMFIPTESEDEAHYTCALLNSTIARLIVRSYAIGTQLAPHILDQLRIPKFDNQDKTHTKLSNCSQRVHMATEKENTKEISSLENEIDAIVANFWNISSRQLQDMKDALLELK